ncbi:AP-1 complex subunit sigma-2-like, partial [Pistacia vera]|uniref:AP-1 complex subunit sigma-2-like n=1 Tax=Pistacia vera TaxID=55513 RepID=UPI0012631C69
TAALSEKVIRELSGVILSQGPKLCNFVEWRGYKVVYKRYASLYFCMCIDQDDNELKVLEIIHHYVEILDRYFGSVYELDLIFNFHKVWCNGLVLQLGFSFLKGFFNIKMVIDAISDCPKYLINLMPSCLSNVDQFILHG